MKNAYTFIDITQPVTKSNLSALPIKLMELEAAPLRAVLITFETDPKRSQPC